MREDIHKAHNLNLILLDNSDQYCLIIFNIGYQIIIKGCGENMGKTEPNNHPIYIWGGLFWTAIIAIAAIVTIILSNAHHNSQIKIIQQTNAIILDQMREDLKRQWQPHLIMEHLYTGKIKRGFSFSDDSIYKEKLRDFDKVPINSGSYINNVKYAYIELNYMLLLNNIGNSSLRCISSSKGLMTKRQWNNSMHSTPEILVTTLVNNDSLCYIDFDVWIHKNENLPIDNEMIHVFIPKSEFDDYLKCGKLILYPYEFIEYMDCFENNYNSLLINCVELDIIKKQENGDSVVEVAGKLLSSPVNFRINVEK